MTIKLHDFTRPAPLAPNLRTEMGRWFSRSNALLVELLAGLSATVELRFAETATEFAVESLARWTDKSLAYQVAVQGCDVPSLIAIPNPLMLELVSRVLGDQPEEVPTERDLTPAEQSIATIIAETIVQSLNDTWQSGLPAGLLLGDTEPNVRRTKLFRPTESIVVCRSSTRTLLGDSEWTWLLTTDFLAQLFGIPRPSTRSAKDQSSRQQLEQLILSMRTGLEIRLGGVQLTGPQLAALRVGDVVVLDQRVSDPLCASVHGEPKFLGWAGRSANRQAFEIESEIQPRSTEASRVA
jgi:flagellar motor switch protein FliM